MGNIEEIIQKKTDKKKEIRNWFDGKCKKEMQKRKQAKQKMIQ